MKPPELAEAFHGEQVGVAALAMARLQDAMLARAEPPVFHPTTITRAEVVARFGEAVGDACWRELAGKALDRARADELTAKLATAWPAMRARLAAIAQPPSVLENILGDAGAPTTAAALGYPDDLVRDAIAHGREIRDRYTFLDFAAETTT
jgi:glycerol-1-phosphate dehydrogenase [NAD(P)+]